MGYDWSRHSGSDNRDSRWTAINFVGSIKLMVRMRETEFAEDFIIFPRKSDCIDKRLRGDRGHRRGERKLLDPDIEMEIVKSLKKKRKCDDEAGRRILFSIKKQMRGKKMSLVIHRQIQEG